MNRILLIEDDLRTAALIKRGLEQEGYAVDHFEDGMSFCNGLAEGHRWKLIVLDLGLPGLNGKDILKSVRSKGDDIPIIILSAKHTVGEKISGLKLGGDDYLTKPFAFAELLARIEALQRRVTKDFGFSTLSAFGITMDLVKHTVTKEGKTVTLQPKEFSLLEYFLRNPDKTLSKETILENVYGFRLRAHSNIIDVLVYRLRNKIDKGFKTKCIQTVRGVGYVFKIQ